jgi:hypothetical protein
VDQCPTEIFRFRGAYIRRLAALSHTPRRSRSRKAPGTAPFSGPHPGMPNSSGTNGLDWLGRLDSNQGMPESKSYILSRRLPTFTAGYHQRPQGYLTSCCQNPTYSVTSTILGDTPVIPTAPARREGWRAGKDNQTCG